MGWGFFLPLLCWLTAWTPQREPTLMGGYPNRHHTQDCVQPSSVHTGQEHKSTSIMKRRWVWPKMASAKCWRNKPSLKTILFTEEKWLHYKSTLYVFIYVVLNAKTKPHNQNQMNKTERLGLKSINLEVAEVPDSCQRNFCSELFWVPIIPGTQSSAIVISSMPVSGSVLLVIILNKDCQTLRWWSLLLWPVPGVLPSYD